MTKENYTYVIEYFASLSDLRNRRLKRRNKDKYEVSFC